MAAVVSQIVHLYTRVGDSEVLNEIGTISVEVELIAITDENRQPTDAAEATVRVLNFDLARALREAADEIEGMSR